MHERTFSRRHQLLTTVSMKDRREGSEGSGSYVFPSASVSGNSETRTEPRFLDIPRFPSLLRFIKFNVLKKVGGNKFLRSIHFLSGYSHFVFFIVTLCHL